MARSRFVSGKDYVALVSVLAKEWTQKTVSIAAHNMDRAVTVEMYVPSFMISLHSVRCTFELFGCEPWFRLAVHVRSHRILQPELRCVMHTPSARIRCRRILVGTSCCL